MTLLLSKSDVARLLDMRDVIDIMQRAFADLATDKAVMPQRAAIPVAAHSGLALFMPAYLKGMGAIGAKIVTVYKDNLPVHGLPTVLGTIALLDEGTGMALALMDGGYLTAMRTGAVAGLAARLLARQDAAVHTIFGTGGMARAQVWAIECARPIRKVILYSIDPKDKREAFRDSIRDIVHGEIVQAENPEQAVAEADILTLITSAKDPVIRGDWVKPGTHINGIGSHAPKLREIDTATLLKAKIVCDLVDACKAEAGDFMIPAEAGEWNWNKVHGSLGDVVAGNIPGRVTDKEITLFKSVGLAVQDISTAQYVYQKAMREKIGTAFDFTR